MNKVVVYSVFGIGIVVLVLGGVLKWLVVPMIVRNKITETVQIREGTEAYDRWKTLPVTMLFKVYIFEVMNPDKITNFGDRPIVRERGPFVYRERRNKVNVEMSEDEDRAIYDQRNTFEFAEDLSVESDETEVTVINIPAISFAHIAEGLPGLRSSVSIYNDVINKMWPDGPIFVKVKVKDYLFNGIKMLCHTDKITDPVEKFKMALMCQSYAYISPEKTVTINDGETGLNTFAFFKYKNGTDGPYEVNLGISEVEEIGQIKKWKKKSDQGEMWGGEICNRMGGTDSTVFRPFLHNVDILTVFNSDICRKVDLHYHSDTEYKGVPARRYSPGSSFLAGVNTNADNYCYCPRSVKGLTTMGGCLHSGVLDLSSCQGAPVLLSYPHFLMADAKYQDMVKGLSPDPEKHQIFVDLEPYTGYPLRGASRAQMNVFLKKIEELDAMKNFPNAITPALWLEEGVELSDELVLEVKDRLLSLLNIADIATTVFLVVGALVAFCSGMWICIKITLSDT